MKVDEDQRPIIEHPDFGHDRSPKRHNDRTHVNGTECKRLKCHVLSSLLVFGSIRIELQHLVVKLLRSRHIGHAVEIANTLPGLFDDSGAVVELRFLVSGDYRARFELFDGVKSINPLATGLHV